MRKGSSSAATDRLGERICSECREPADFAHTSRGLTSVDVAVTRRTRVPQVAESTRYKGVTTATEAGMKSASPLADWDR